MDDEIRGHTELGHFLTGPGITDLPLTGHCSKGAGPDLLGRELLSPTSGEMVLLPNSSPLWELNLGEHSEHSDLD